MWRCATPASEHRYCRSARAPCITQVERAQLSATASSRRRSLGWAPIFATSGASRRRWRGYGERFTCTRVHRSGARARRAATERLRAATYAKRFAAKEACAKALGTGFRQRGILRRPGVVNLLGGQPTMTLPGGAAARLAALIPRACAANRAQLTDEYPYAYAQVIISAVQRGGPPRR